MELKYEVDMDILLHSCEDPLFCEVRYLLKNGFNWKELQTNCPWRKILKNSYELHKFKEKQRHDNMEWPDEAVDV